MTHEPKTLQEAIIYFADADNCLDFLAIRRWPNGVICPTCGRKDVAFVPSRRLWQCKTRHPKAQFSIKTGTVLEDSPLGLEKWLPVMWLVANCKNGVSSWEIHRALGVAQKTAWFMLHRIRLGMQTSSKLKLGGPDFEVEVDETFIGGKARFMHKSVRARRITGRGKSIEDKTAVMGLLERGGEVRAQVIPNRAKDILQGIVRGNVETGAAVFTDELHGYWGLSDQYEHEIIDHAVKYVDGRVHTNGLENFWSLLKRGLKGTYIAVEPFHLFRYLDEQSFRFNNRATRNNPLNDSDRFSLLCSQIVGKRLTYAGLTAKEDKKPDTF
jgi:transposase-like protein